MTTGRTSRLWLRPRNVNRLRPTRPIRTRLSLSPLEDRAVPAILTVTDAGDTGPNTLRGIMATADTNGEADTIQFGGGITTINLTSGEIGYTTDVNNLTINGAGVTVNGDAVAAATNRIFKFNVAGGDPTITINGLTMSAGNLTSGNNGGAILANNDPLVLDGATFSGNKTAGTGGAISLGALTTLTVTNCTFSSNTSTGAGGAIVSSTGASTITVTGSTFTGNKGSTGGVITASASLTVVNLTSSTFTSNTSTSSGGVLYAAVQSTWQIDQCQFVNNAATGVGGAIRMTSTSPTFNVNNSTFSGNTCTTNGGAIYFAGSSANPVTINNSTFSNNTAGTSGAHFTSPARPLTPSTIARFLATLPTATRRRQAAAPSTSPAPSAW